MRCPGSCVPGKLSSAWLTVAVEEVFDPMDDEIDPDDGPLIPEELALLEDDHPCWCDCGCTETVVFPDERCERCLDEGHEG